MERKQQKRKEKTKWDIKLHNRNKAKRTVHKEVKHLTKDYQANLNL